MRLRRKNTTIRSIPSEATASRHPERRTRRLRPADYVLIALIVAGVAVTAIVAILNSPL